MSIQNLDPKGLRLDVYRNAAHGGTGATNGGVTGTHTRLTLIGYQARPGGPIQPLPQDSQVFGVTEDAPAVVLVPSNLSGVFTAPHLVPEDIVRYGAGPNVGPMFGGNYAGASDSRFNDLIRRVYEHDGDGLVAVHDRVETPDQYRALSQ